MNKIKTFLILLLTVFVVNSCGVYSFTGTSISPDVKTVSIDFFQNMAPLVVPTLSNTFTDALKDKFIKQTKLELLREDGDLQFSGEIRGYDIQPAAITGEEVASLNRLTIRVKVKFVNKKDESQNFDRDFSAYEDFPGAASIEQYQSELITKITETLTENIFNASVANW